MRAKGHCSPDDVFLEVWLRVVENMLDKSCQEYWKGEQHKEARHKPGGHLGVVVLGADMIDEQGESEDK